MQLTEEEEIAFYKEKLKLHTNFLYRIKVNLMYLFAHKDYCPKCMVYRYWDIKPLVHNGDVIGIIQTCKVCNCTVKFIKGAHY